MIDVKESKNTRIMAWRLGYDKSLQKARSTYAKIGKILCPALDNDLVTFNSIGFKHLMRKGKDTRPRNEQKRRFILIQYIEEIISDTNAIVEFREYLIKEIQKRYGEKVRVQSLAKFWTFVDSRKGCKIKVVVRQVGNGQKHFFSVMGDRVFIAKNSKSHKTKKSHS